MHKIDLLRTLFVAMMLISGHCFAETVYTQGHSRSIAIGEAAAVDHLSGFYSIWNQRFLTHKGKGLYSAMRSDSFSEVMSIDAIADHFRGPLDPGELAVTHNAFEFGVALGGWRLGRMWRYDYVLRFSEDTAYLNYQLEHGGSASLDLDYTYDIYLQADHIRSNGFIVGKTLPVMMFKSGLLDIELAWMTSTQFYDGYAKGKFQRGQLNENSLDQFTEQLDLSALEAVTSFDDAVDEAKALQLVVDEIRQSIESSNLWLETDYSYYRPGLREDEIASLEEIRAINARGSGFSLSLELYMPLNDRWTIQMGARDLISAIRWRDVGNTQGNLYITEGSKELLGIVDHLLQEDIINRFSGLNFTPLNPENPSDPEPAIEKLIQEIRAEYANISAYKGSFTQHLPRQYQLATYYKIDERIMAELIYRKNKVANFFGMGVWLWDTLYFGVEPESQGWQLGVRHQYGSLLLKSDTGDVETAKRITLEGSLNLIF